MGDCICRREHGNEGELSWPIGIDKSVNHMTKTCRFASMRYLAFVRRKQKMITSKAKLMEATEIPCAVVLIRNAEQQGF